MIRLCASLLTGLVLVGCAPPDATGPADTSAVHARALTLDTHVDIPFEFATEAFDPMTADAQVNLAKMRAGGLDAAFFIVYVGQTERTPDNYAQAQRDAIRKFEAIHRMTETLYPEVIGLATSADDVVRLNAEGRLAAAIGIENGYVIGTDLALLDRYHALGARYMTLAHNGHNDLADSAQPREALGDGATEHGGVSELGAAVIERMNELGIIVDISHASRQAALEAIALSRAPVIASHSAVTGVTDHVRNLDDATLHALERNGGVVQIVAYPPYVKRLPPEHGAALRALEERLGLPGPTDPLTLDDGRRIEYTEGLQAIQRQWPAAAVEDLIDHVDYAVQLIGIEHVGISSDFGGGGGIVGWAEAGETMNVTAELLARGYTEAEIGQLWSGNLLRVWRDVERIAATLQNAI